MNQTPRISSSSYLASQKAVRKRNKFGARKVEIAGMKFDSAGEARRYEELRLLELAGEIAELERQKRIWLRGLNNVAIQYESGQCASYVADFAYWVRDPATGHLGHWQLEDFKGFDTPDSKLKRAIVQAMYGRPVLVTKSPKRSSVRQGRAA